jgi:hypothetical protein
VQAAKEFEDKVAKPVADFTQVWGPLHPPPPPSGAPSGASHAEGLFWDGVLP